MSVELFYDKDYEIECRNKIPYLKVLRGEKATSLNLEEKYKFFNGDEELEPENLNNLEFYLSDNTLILINKEIENIHIKNTENHSFCYEIIIGENVKKFILD